MIIKKITALKEYVTIGDIETALEKVNEKYEGNIDTYGIEEKKYYYLTRLKTKNTEGKGASVSMLGRKTGSACWHVYRDFFKALPEETKVITTTAGKIITGDDYWEQRYYDPEFSVIAGLGIAIRHSQLCFCNNEDNWLTWAKETLDYIYNSGLGEDYLYVITPTAERIKKGVEKWESIKRSQI